MPAVAPQLPKLLELVGLGYTAWFTYRYLLFKVCIPTGPPFLPPTLAPSAPYPTSTYQPD